MEYTKSEKIVIRMTPEQKQFVEQKATRLGMKLSDYARTLLLAFDLVDWPPDTEKQDATQKDD